MSRVGTVLTFGLAAVTAIWSPNALANPEARQLIIFVSGAAVFPSGRFGEKIIDKTPDDSVNSWKDGHRAGVNGALEVGYVLSDRLAAGLAFDLTRFPLDFAIPFGQNGATTVAAGNVWVRYFLPGGFRRWQPFVRLATGFGRAKAGIDFPEPVPIVEAEGDTLWTERLESRTETSSLIGGGIGTVVPLTRRVGLSLEGVFWRLATGGADRTDKFYLDDGTSKERTRFPSGALRRVRSDTNWWQIRAGLTVSLL